MEITIKNKIVLRNIVYRFLRTAAFIWRKFNFLDLPSAAKFISKEFGKDDVILLKGKSTDHLSRILFANLVI